jgi:hypothetical protein
VKTPEKMIPKATLLRALHEIMDAARDPEGFTAATSSLGPAENSVEARAYALGWIEATARGVLGAEAPTTGWLASTAKAGT